MARCATRCERLSERRAFGLAISASSHYESDGAVDFVAGASGVLRRIEPERSNDGPYEADEYGISRILHGLQPRSCVGGDSNRDDVVAQAGWRGRIDSVSG